MQDGKLQDLMLTYLWRIFFYLCILLDSFSTWAGSAQSMGKAGMPM